MTIRRQNVKQNREDREYAVKARRCRCDHCQRWLALYRRFVAVQRLAALRRPK